MKQEKFEQKVLALLHSNNAVKNKNSIFPFYFAIMLIFDRRLAKDLLKTSLFYSIVANLINTEYLATQLTDDDLSKEKLVNKINTIT